MEREKNWELYKEGQEGTFKTLMGFFFKRILLKHKQTKFFFTKFYLGFFFYLRVGFPTFF